MGRGGLAGARLRGSPAQGHPRPAGQERDDSYRQRDDSPAE
jgi:hypothetical protein